MVRPSSPVPAVLIATAGGFRLRRTDSRPTSVVLGASALAVADRRSRRPRRGVSAIMSGPAASRSARGNGPHAAAIVRMPAAAAGGDVVHAVTDVDAPLGRRRRVAAPLRRAAPGAACDGPCRRGTRRPRRSARGSSARAPSRADRSRLLVTTPSRSPDARADRSIGRTPGKGRISASWCSSLCARYVASISSANACGSGAPSATASSSSDSGSERPKVAMSASRGGQPAFRCRSNVWRHEARMRSVVSMSVPSRSNSTAAALIRLPSQPGLLVRRPRRIASRQSTPP